MNDQQSTQMTTTKLSPESSLPLALEEPTKSDARDDDQQQYSEDDEQEVVQTQQNPSSKPHQGKNTQSSCTVVSEESATNAKALAAAEEEDNGRERLKRHRIEVAGRVWIPDIWGQEGMLKDWIDCSAFDASLVSSNIMSARAALAQKGRSGLRIENRLEEAADHPPNR